MVRLMTVSPADSVPEPARQSTESRRVGLLLSRDLIFTTKVKTTTVELGYSMIVAGTEAQARLAIEEQRPTVILIDLTAGTLVAPGALLAYQRLAGQDTWFVAFGPHVEVGALSAAKAAGCHVVLARSRFSSELPQLIARFFSEPPRHDR